MEELQWPDVNPHVLGMCWNAGCEPDLIVQNKTDTLRSPGESSENGGEMDWGQLNINAHCNAPKAYIGVMTVIARPIDC